MSNGSGPIIIDAAINAPATTSADKAELVQIRKRYEADHRCSLRDALKVCHVVWKLLR